MKYLEIRLLKNKLANFSMLGLTITSVLLAVAIGVGLFVRSYPLIASSSLSQLLGGAEWLPFQNKFGFYPFIIGTLQVTFIAIVLALPLSLATALYLYEFAPRGLKKIVVPVIDLLSGIPPVVFGVWGVLLVVPFVGDVLAPHFVEFSTGYSVLSGGIVLAIMIFPLIINILLEVFATVPQGLKDASLSLGATQWQTLKKVLLVKAAPGILAATVLAISRAFGETIAVLMVCGNVPTIAENVFDPAYTLPALIANNYGEMLSIPLYDSALLFAAFLLFVIILIFNTISRLILYKIEHK